MCDEIHGVPRYWLEAVLKRETRDHEWVVRDYLVPLVADYIDQQKGSVDAATHVETKHAVRQHLDKMDHLQMDRCLELAIPDVLLKLATQHRTEYEAMLGERFYWYATEEERLGLKSG